MSIKVLLADDHVMVREGLGSVLERDPDIEVVGVAGDGRTAVELSARLSPDVVVMDIGMPGLNGIEATRQIVGANPQVKVVALSAYPDRGYVLGMLDAGAHGYVLKAAVSEELLRAIRAVTQGRHYLSSEIAGVVIKGIVNRASLSEESVYSVLAQREREVLQLLAEGKSVKETAAGLDISVRTVETHRRNIMKKLDLHSIAELTKYAIREGITRLEG
jgi:DNA-binding NarL/FixJ family response regulator